MKLALMVWEEKLWGLLKKKLPKVSSAIPVGKKDRKGNLITNHKGLKKLYLRKELCENEKSKPWEMKDLDEAIKSLKKDKARDPNGWIIEIFKEGVAGKDLKFSMLAMFNRIKSEKTYPTFMRKANVTTLYKGKGEKSNLENDRGIFIVPIFRSIIMKMMYKEIYETIDNSMSDSQIGSRKAKNIRNHIWVLNSVICDVLSSKKKKSIDIGIYDYRQCFDSLWLEECLNDMYAGGLQNDKFNLLYEANADVNIAVRTPVEKTEEGNMFNNEIHLDLFFAVSRWIC